MRGGCCTGVRGGLAAGLLFVAPGAAVVLVLSILYAFFRPGQRRRRAVPGGQGGCARDRRRWRCCGSRGGRSKAGSAWRSRARRLPRARRLRGALSGGRAGRARRRGGAPIGIGRPRSRPRPFPFRCGRRTRCAPSRSGRRSGWCRSASSSSSPVRTTRSPAWPSLFSILAVVTLRRRLCGVGLARAGRRRGRGGG